MENCAELFLGVLSWYVCITDKQIWTLLNHNLS